MQFSLDTIQNEKALHSRRYQIKDFDWSLIKQCHRVQPMSDVILSMLQILSFVWEDLKVLAFLNNLEIYTDD